MGCQPKNNLVKDEYGDLLADSHSILRRCKNYFSQLMNMYNVSDARQIVIHTAEPVVSGPSHLKFEICYCKFEKV
jgi:hypothetical protein